MVGTETLRDVGRLGPLGKDMLTGGTGQIGGQPLREHGLEAQGVEHFAGEEDVDHHRLVRAAEGVHNGAGHRAVEPVISGPDAGLAAAAGGKAHPGVRRVEQAPGRFWGGGDPALDDIA